MSDEGIKIFASVLTIAQQARYELIKMGTEDPIDKEDIRLGHLLDEMKDSVKEKFYKITLEREHHSKGGKP